MRYVAVPVEFLRVGQMSVCRLIKDADGHGSTDESAFVDLIAKLGYKEAVELTISDKMRDVAQWYDLYHNARHGTDDVSGELYTWAHSIEVCEGKKGAE
jgi:hypothetical protein